MSDWSSDVCSSDLLALHRDEDLDHLEHARGEFVAAFELLLAVLELVVDALYGLVVLRLDRFDLRLTIVIGNREREPFNSLYAFEQLGTVSSRAGVVKYG